MRETFSAEAINKMIPMPVMVKLPANTLGKPWWLQLWLYFTVPTQYMLVGNWMIRLPNGMRILFPDGFVFDGASIPWFLRWLMTSFGPLLQAAIFHDFGYRYNFLFDWAGIPYALERGQKFYDELFREIVIWTTGLVVLADAACAGLWAFGFIAWNRHRREEVAV